MFTSSYSNPCKDQLGVPVHLVSSSCWPLTNNTCAFFPWCRIIKGKPTFFKQISTNTELSQCEMCLRLRPGDAASAGAHIQWPSLPSSDAVWWEVFYGLAALCVVCSQGISRVGCASTGWEGWGSLRLLVLGCSLKQIGQFAVGTAGM